MEKNNLTYYYDQEADILYVSKGKPLASDMSEELSDGLIARYDSKTNKVKGFTILNFAKRTKRGSESVSLPFGISFS